mmetsp:Transcript_14874/g.39837  ORF Transcript_14874/g.39837 Transcript_14874/m.39837 type:complete len:247 (-) Transcript_14874:561-1301(-)
MRSHTPCRTECFTTASALNSISMQSALDGELGSSVHSLRASRCSLLGRLTESCFGDEVAPSSSAAVGSTAEAVSCAGELNAAVSLGCSPRRTFRKSAAASIRYSSLEDAISSSAPSARNATATACAGSIPSVTSSSFANRAHTTCRVSCFATARLRNTTDGNTSSRPRLPCSLVEPLRGSAGALAAAPIADAARESLSPAQRAGFARSSTDRSTDFATDVGAAGVLGAEKAFCFSSTARWQLSRTL